MATISDDALALVQTALSQLNETLPEEDRLPVEPGTQLVGEDGGLDSFGMLDMITTVEELVQKNCDAAIALVQDDEVAMLVHFQTVQSLGLYVAQLVEDARSTS